MTTMQDGQHGQAEPDGEDATGAVGAAEAWRALGELTGLLRASVLSAAHGLELTPGESRALDALDPERPRPMRALAEALCCDASNVTWLVDRLEARGLVVRRPSPTDRRVKAVALTPAGTDARTRLLEAMATPPAFIGGLPEEDLAELTRLVGRLVEAARGNTEAGAGGSGS